jgi:pyruvate dehydrogenase E2 component (dihydrolipoamide acetyltransferase)
MIRGLRAPARPAPQGRADTLEREDSVGKIDLPRLGYATSEATVLRWLKAVGDSVTEREALVELASEKAIQVLGSPQAGTLLAIYAPPGAVIETGEPLAWIGAPGERAPQLTPRLVGWEPGIAPGPAESEPAARIVPAPAARLPAHSVPKAERELLRGQLRHTTALRMEASWRAPKVDLFAEVDFTRVQAHRLALKEQGGEAPSYNVYIAHAVVRAFQDFPHLNLQWWDGQLRPLDGIHVGIAVALGDNLVTVSLKNLAGLGLAEMQRRLKGLIKKALGLALSHDELFGSSLTITNLGEWDVRSFAALLNPPEIFILAVGKLEERPAVRDGQVVPRLQCTFCLSFDHRGVDGAPASRLLQRIKQNLERFDDRP